MSTQSLITDVQKALGISVDGSAGLQTWSAIYQSLLKQAAPLMDEGAIIRAVQSNLGLAVDGNAGPETWTAIQKKIIPTTTAPSNNNGNATPAFALDSRSEATVSQLLPEVQPLARALVQKAAEQGITIRIISGMRTYADQDKLYAQGRTAPGTIVTNAKGGFSNHNFGLAFDIGVFENGVYQPESAHYATLGPIGVSLGLAWGGNWKAIQDMPHYELRPQWASDLSESSMLAELRQRVSNSDSLLV